ncbi:MAG: F0F1 ATP synthase subunit A [Cytophagales bacterium]
MKDFVKGAFFNTLRFSLLVFIFIFGSLHSFANEEKHHEEVADEKFNASEMIIHHIQDAYDWHFADFNGHAISLPLPIILYSSTKGLVTFLSSEFHHGESAYLGYKLEHNHIISEEAGEKIYDLSITKNVASLMISAILLVFVFVSVSNSFKKNHGKAPKGIQSLFEPLIVFIRDEIARPNIGEHNYAKYMPYLLTSFFFIWFNNLLGLIPSGANVTGNIAVTLTMAAFTLVLTLFSGNKNYWKHIFATPGVPVALLPIMIPVEIIGIFTKPFALMIRLFANITAGHIIILSILSFIFLFKNLGVAAVSVPFAVAMSLMEVFVAILQAYIFTLLSALFIGQAVAEHDHDDHH